MHNYLDKLENQIKGNNIGKIFFNRYYSLRDLYWTLYYAFSLSLLAGFGNVFFDKGTGNFSALLFHGFLNNFYLSFFINIFYSRVMNWLSKFNNLRRNGNILAFIIMILFITWHQIIGTENPVQANIMPGIASFLLTNHHISVLKRRSKPR